MIDQFRKLSTRTLLGLGLLLSARQTVTAQDAPVLTVEEQSVVTVDGWKLPMTYYRVDSREAPVVVMLHGKNGNRLVYDKGPVPKSQGLAEQVHAKGYAVITVDLRKHGKAELIAPGARSNDRISSRDYAAMIRGDMEAIQKFLYEEHQKERLNMRKTILVGSEEMAAVAAIWGYIDWGKKPYSDAPTPAASTPRGQTVRGFILLSPVDKLAVPRTLAPPMTEALTYLRAHGLGGPGIGFLIGVGAEDKQDRGDAKKVYNHIMAIPQEFNDNPIPKRTYLREYPRGERGTDLLKVGTIKLVPEILGFLDKHVKPLDDRWESRKSKLGN